MTTKPGVYKTHRLEGSSCWELLLSALAAGDQEAPEAPSLTPIAQIHAVPELFLSHCRLYKSFQ